MSTPPPIQDPKQPDRYSGLETHELIQLLDDVEDERGRARFRESVYLAIILWLLIIALLRWGPHYLWKQPYSISAIRPKQENQATMIELPPDVVKKIPRVKPAPHIATRDQQSQSPKPSPQQAMPEPGRPSPPAPLPPTPQPQQQQPQRPQQQATNQPPPRPQSQQPPLIDAPKPSPTRPNFNTNASASDQIQQAAKNARTGGGQSGSYGNAPSSHGGLNAGAKILSDTQGVDFAKYLQRLQHDVEQNWYPLIPEECRPPLLKQGITGIQFSIGPDGTILAMKLVYSTHDTAINKSAWGSIQALGKAQPLPKEFHGPSLDLEFGFYVNKELGVR